MIYVCLVCYALKYGKFYEYVFMTMWAYDYV